MRNRIGEGRPGGPRRKSDFGLLDLGLVALIGLHRVVDAQHEVVVQAPLAFRDVQ
jgi:hypothetical protein